MAKGKIYEEFELDVTAEMPEEEYGEYGEIKIKFRGVDLTALFDSDELEGFADELAAAE